jgi:hypothetical protein
MADIIINDDLSVLTNEPFIELNIVSLYNQLYDKYNSQLNAQSVDTLKEKCKNNNIGGCYKLKKDEIVVLLLDKFNKCKLELLGSFTREILQDICRENKIKFSNKKKLELIEAIINYNMGQLKFIECDNLDNKTKYSGDSSDKKERSSDKKKSLEKKSLEKECLEKERLEKERLEKECLEKERVEKECLEKERLEKERLEKECLEKERLEKERLEKERLEKERLEKERLEKERLEKERLEKECLEKERLEKERLEKERLEKERLEKERLEKERLEKERLEKERLEKERLEKERLEKERLELKKKKQTIPKNIKSLVWNHYIGDDINMHKCLCCKKITIKIVNFHVGHVISEKDGGTHEIGNLRPICDSCNHSMGTTNMIEFVKMFGLYVG